MRQMASDNWQLSYIEAGEGALVLLLHGFPDLSSAWKSQLDALAAAGYRAVAPDLRGYGRSGGPDDIAAYSIYSLVGDMVELVQRLGYVKCVVIGHDWGASLAWHCALLRPDIFQAVMGLSLPFQPRRKVGPPTDTIRLAAEQNGGQELYLKCFAEAGSHTYMDADPERALKRIFWCFDGATPDEHKATGLVEPGKDFIECLSDKSELPPWMKPEDFAAHVESFRKGGFEKPLFYYRKIDDNWSRTRWLQGMKVNVPSYYLVGECDPVRRYMRNFENVLEDFMTDLRGVRVLKGAGHWINRERPDEVNDAILGFLWEVSSLNWENSFSAS